MNNLKTADEITDEVGRIARRIMDVIDRIGGDAACAQAARLAVGAALLTRSVVSAAELETVNLIWAGRWRMERAH